MSPLPRRPLTILDAMALVAPVAIGLTLWRTTFAGMGLFAGPPWSVEWIVRSGPIPCLLMTVAVTLVALRMIRPRPRWRRLVRQPGFVACVASLASMVLGLASSLATVATITLPPGGTLYTPTGAFWQASFDRTGEFVIGAWIALWLTGRWAAEPSWIDRAGRVVGLLWAARFVVVLIADPYSMD